MIKKIWVLLFTIAILNIWINCFGDVISVEYNEPEICRIFESVEIDNWRIIMLDDWNEVEEVYANSCINNKWKFYILSNDINIKDVWKENINEKAERIKVWENEWGVQHDWRPQRHEYTYKIIRNESWLYEAQRIKENIIYLENENTNKNRLSSNYIWIKKFVLSRILTTIIETIVLILISKFCRKSWLLKNWKLLFTWILASTITLPLLWFVIPKFFSNYLVYIIFWEVFVTIIETFIIKYSLKIERKMAIFASILCNLSSFLVWTFIILFLKYFSRYSSLSLSSRIHFELMISSIILKIRNSWIYSILFEPIILFIVLRLFRNNETSKKRIFLIWFLASLLTLPLLWFILPYFLADKSEYIVFWIIVIIESFIIKYWLKIWRWKAMILSIVCNVLSYSIRKLLTYLS